MHSNYVVPRTDGAVAEFRSKVKHGRCIVPVALVVRDAVSKGLAVTRIRELYEPEYSNNFTLWDKCLPRFRSRQSVPQRLEEGRVVIYRVIASIPSARSGDVSVVDW